ncbi:MULTISPECIES: bifunctional protein-disulfide isomerase/oxidoreductase DsbC [unclassified Gilliamella]|uniref:bifunctional protein-disulfide isomerase/oxidoreductase DsbC n=1 Tax=unclassified Gilliamella TaxID=2685620 RepID=UPI00226A8EC6|nr:MULTISPECIES: bifunctional protein-disulfide isomerase/oxidoreductase DsbC [unclassified Gilliamella]MCX8575317.1 bifunctional protein-disulfide isomerase/oxidoreductase DsbC [Gilliamella sp. B3831]MCX8577637.1 bifunctional protein-disulfide isomerase/oxidoreductase DsbC [Gilliamella sp. B3815]MCX8579599.1 bifunctional protein-disulfide isomerase/oxidoreductase DsbC [Gilliamella sp. B2717]MCX8589064.1 bifunctional protein-disulfide isomerase/oxidoreductase DsbC [Gilliamella sp. B3801]MCX858
MKKLVLGLALISTSVLAGNSDITDTMSKLGYENKDLKITNTPVKGLKSVVTPDGTFYVTDDGKYLTQGPIYNVEGDEPKNIANSTNLALMKTIEKDAIIYKAKDEKYVISVFTDYTCHYCKLLHENIDQYLNNGISVHYFAYPRAGADSEVGKNMQSIWSVADRKAAFDKAYKGDPITPATSDVPYVTQQFNVGRQLGISGTPSIVLSDGQLIPGYVPADKLIEILKNTAK